MKFRIKHVNGRGYYPQVKGFMCWKRIGVHTHGFGLYDEDSESVTHETQESAQKVIDDYVKWKASCEVRYIPTKARA